MRPKRIQRKRSKGWRMPEGVVYVGRPTKWGNPFSIVPGSVDRPNRAAVTELYRRWLLAEGGEEAKIITRDIEQLRGKDLACWCPLTDDCHVDVLIELANREVLNA